MCKHSFEICGTVSNNYKEMTDSVILTCIYCKEFQEYYFHTLGNVLRSIVFKDIQELNHRYSGKDEILTLWPSMTSNEYK